MPMEMSAPPPEGTGASGAGLCCPLPWFFIFFVLLRADSSQWRSVPCPFVGVAYITFFFSCTRSCGQAFAAGPRLH